MTAYSFKKQFVAPIREGLLVPPMRATLYPKRQTIRADRRRHARPGEELQLYCGMRTKGCFLIGRARCVSVEPIRLYFEPGHAWGVVRINDAPTTICEPRKLDAFARGDGFEDWRALQAFWEAEHGDPRFAGVLIRWEPIT